MSSPAAELPTIALIALAFNHARYLPQLFDSIHANLDDLDEIVLIDNGSSDTTGDLMRAFGETLPARIRFTLLLNPPRHGVAAAVNEGLCVATSTYVAVTSGDDFLLPARFSIQRAAMAADPTLQFCYSNGYVCDDRGVVSDVPLHSGTTLALLSKDAGNIASALFYPVPALFTQCGLFRRSALLDIGGWDEDLVIDDWPLNIKLFRRFGTHYRYVDAFVAAYRRHDNNASKRRYRQYMGQKRVLEKYARGSELKRGLFALLAAQCLSSLKRRQWYRVRVFGRSALAQGPGAAFIFKWLSNEARRQFFTKNKIR